MSNEKKVAEMMTKAGRPTSEDNVKNILTGVDNGQLSEKEYKEIMASEGFHKFIGYIMYGEYLATGRVSGLSDSQLSRYVKIYKARGDKPITAEEMALFISEIVRIYEKCRTIN